MLEIVQRSLRRKLPRDTRATTQYSVSMYQNRSLRQVGGRAPESSRLTAGARSEAPLACRADAIDEMRPDDRDRRGRSISLLKGDVAIRLWRMWVWLALVATHLMSLVHVQALRCK